MSRSIFTGREIFPWWLKGAMEGIVYYSSQLIAIKSSSLSETEKNEQLALYIAEALEQAIMNRQTGLLQFDEGGGAGDPCGH